MSLFGVGPERFSVSAMIAGASFNDEQEQAVQQAGELRPVIDVAKVAEEARKLMNSPEHSDMRKEIEEQLDAVTKPAKRKYTKRAK